MFIFLSTVIIMRSFDDNFFYTSIIFFTFFYFRNFKIKIFSIKLDYQVFIC